MTGAVSRSPSLGDLCDRITVGHVGPMADRYVPDGVPFLRSQDIGEFHIDTCGIKFIPADFDEKLRKSRLRAGDVVVVRTGYPGTAAVVPPELDGANCADLVIISPGTKLDAWYVASLLNSAWGKGHIAGVLVGVAQQHFNVGAARTLKADFPIFEIQQRIGSIIKAYCDLIEVNQRRIAILEEMAQRLFEEWFLRFRYPGHEAVPLVETELGLAPEGWIVKCLPEVAEITYGFPFKSKIFNSDGSGTKLIRIRDIPNGDSKTYTTEIHDEKYFAGDGDILIGMDGNFHIRLV